MKICPNCGNQEDKNYCSQCRSTMVPLEQPQPQPPKKNMLPVIFGGIAALMLLAAAILVALGVIPLNKKDEVEETPKQEVTQTDKEPEETKIVAPEGNDYSDVDGGFSVSFDEDEELSLGEISGSKYENKFIGIGFKKPSGWTFSDEDDLKETNNLVKDYSIDEVKDAIDKSGAAILMMATDGAGTSVNVTVEKATAFQLANTEITDIYDNNISLIVENMEAMGFTDVSYEIGSAKVDGINVDTIEGVLAYQTTKMYQKAFMVKCDGYLANVTITTAGSDTTDDVLKNIYWLN